MSCIEVGALWHCKGNLLAVHLEVLLQLVVSPSPGLHSSRFAISIPQSYSDALHINRGIVAFPFQMSDPPPAQTFCPCYPLVFDMSSIFHLEHSLPTFQSLIFFASSIAALLLLAALYAARSNAPPSIPLYVPETAAAGNQKKRWMYDSVNLLQEAYKKVRDDDSVFLLIYR